LKNRHVKMTPVALYRLIEECFQVKTSRSLEDILPNIDHVCTLGDRIFAIGLPDRDTWNAMVMLHSLGPDLSHVRDSLLAHVSDDLLDMALVKQRLRTEVEMLRKESATATVAAATASKPPKAKSKQRSHKHDSSQDNNNNCAGQGGVKDGKRQKADSKDERPSGKQTSRRTPKPTNSQQVVRLQDGRLYIGEVVNVGSAPSSSNNATANAACIEEVDEWGLQAICDVDDNDSEFAAITSTTPPPRPPLGPNVPESLEWQKDWALTVNSDIVSRHVGNTNWWLDTGASIHCTPYLSDLVDIRDIAPIRIRGIQGAAILATKMGTVQLPVSSSTPLSIANVVWLPNAKIRLLSIGSLADAGLNARFSKTWATIHHAGGNSVVARATCIGRGLYSLDLGSSEQVNIAVPIDVWHGRLGHPAKDTVLTMAQSVAVSGMHVDLLLAPPTCQSCIVGKQKTTPIPKVRTGQRATRIFDVVYCDLSGGLDRTATPSGDHYSCTLVDDFSSCNWTFLLKSKTDARCIVKCWHACVTRQVGYSLGTLRIDNRELKSLGFETFCASNGITLQYTAPHTSAENGKVEQMHGTLMGRARAIREAANLPPTLWGECMLTAAFLANYLPTRSLPRGKTPFELWHGCKPDVSFLREVSCTAYALIQNAHNPKILGRSIKCQLIGYEPNSKSYRLWYPEGRKIISTRNVRFVESHELRPQPLRPGQSLDIPSNKVESHPDHGWVEDKSPEPASVQEERPTLEPATIQEECPSIPQCEPEHADQSMRPQRMRQPPARPDEPSRRLEQVRADMRKAKPAGKLAKKQ
jgi:hypothetical protein